MALTEDIRVLGVQSTAALDATHDYYAHTKGVWRLLQVGVQHQGLTATIKNRATGSFVNEQDLLRLAQPYVTEYLRSATFQQFVSLFEDFVFDLLRLWLGAYPKSLGRKQVELSTVLQSASTAEVVQGVIERELNDLKYRRVTEWFEYLNGLVDLPCPTNDEQARLAEMKAARDVLVHNKGIVGAVYLSKAGAHARCAVGQRLDLSEPYHRDSWAFIKKVIQDVSKAAERKA